jgi:hypothetical protein
MACVASLIKLIFKILSKLASLWFHLENEIGMNKIFESPWLALEKKMIV